MFYDPTPRNTGLDHRLSSFGKRFQATFHGYRTAKNGCPDMEEGFLFLCILGGSAVRFLFWTRMIFEG
jgi:hypothetical protein